MTAIDKSKYTPMMQQYLTIKETYPETLLFFRLGDFYELFFDDALKASKLLEITLTSRAGGDEKIPMCGVPHHAAQSYIQKLVDVGEKVVIAEQTSEPTGGPTLVTREVTKIITPGTFVQEGMFESTTNSYIAAIEKVENTFVIAYGDISIGKYYYMEQIANMSELIDMIRTVSPVELIIREDQFNFFHETVEPLGILVDAVKQVQPTLNVHIADSARSVFSLLETYLVSVRPDSMQSFQFLKEIQFNQAMYISASTSASLELFETIKTRNREGSLLSLLDATKTAIGARMLRHWIGHPLINEQAIANRQDVVASLLDDYMGRVKLQEGLGKVYDIERLISRIAAMTAKPRELHQLKLTMLAVEEILDFVEQPSTSVLIKKQLQKVGNIHPVTQILVDALATENVSTLKETGIFNPGYSQALDELVELTKGGASWLVELEAKEKDRTGIKNLRIKYNKVFGYFIEVSKGNAHLVQEDWGYERKQTLTNAERFITAELKAKEEQILSANERLVQLEQQLFDELCQKIIPYQMELQQLADFVAWLDVLQSFAQISQEYRYVRPQVRSKSAISLKNSRHPVIEQVVGEHFIPNDLFLDEQGILLITGPNMSGKSTYMRQIALCSIMAQVGCYVPADEAELPVFDAIFTRIGAQDDLFSGESTFMVEMKEVSQALYRASENSLLLFDEIGRGTATYDGLALAYAILKYIDESVHARTLFSTHYHELTEFALQLKHVKNVHVSASLHDDEIIFHHRVKDGSIEKSYGVQVAKLAKLPDAVIEESKQVLVVLESNHLQIDGSVVSEEVIKEAVSASNQIDMLQSKYNRLHNFINSIEKLDINEISPRKAWETLEKIQDQISTLEDE